MRSLVVTHVLLLLVSGVVQQSSCQVSPNCAVNVAGTPRTYAACSTLHNEPQPYSFYYTYDAAAGTLDGAFAYPMPAGWVAWGVNPGTPGAMLGGEALVVKANASSPTGASIQDYALDGYTPAAVHPPSRLQVLSSAADAAGGQLRGSFKIKIPAGMNPAQFNFLYVFGPLGPGGALAQHSIPNGLSDNVNLLSAVAPAAAAGTAAPATAARAALPRAEPADETSAARLQNNRSGTDDGLETPESESEGSESESETPPAPQAATASTGTAATASTAASRSNTSGGSCTVQLANGVEAFDSCASLTGTPGTYTFAWRLLSGNRLRGAIDAVNPDNGFVGWGQGPGGLRMVPGNGIIVKRDASAASGASAADYRLGGYKTDQVTRPSAWAVTDVQAAAGSGGRITAAFTLQLDALSGNAAAFPIIYTMGPISSTGGLLPHDSANGNTAQLDLTSATVSGQVNGNDRRSGNLPTVHGWLNIVGLGVLLPLAVATAATMREWPSWWFNIHRSLAVVGFLLGVAGIGIGLYMRPFQGSDEHAHEALGLIVLGLAVVQLLLGLLRPSPEHKLRRYWNPVHHWCGRILLAIIIANIYIGIHISQHIAANHRKNWYIAYSVILGVIVALAASKAAINLATGGGLKQAGNQHRASDEERDQHPLQGADNPRSHSKEYITA